MNYYNEIKKELVNNEINRRKCDTIIVRVDNTQSYKENKIKSDNGILSATK